MISDGYLYDLSYTYNKLSYEGELKFHALGLWNSISAVDLTFGAAFSSSFDMRIAPIVVLTPNAKWIRAINGEFWRVKLTYEANHSIRDLLLSY